VTDPTQLHAPPPGRQELEGRQELSADDRRRLRELCERATPGPWTVKKSGNAEWRNLVNVVEGGDGSLIVYGQISDKDAAFVVAAHPGLVLSLLDENDALKINVEGAHAWLDEAAGPDHSDHTPDGLRLRVEGLVKRLDAAEADRDKVAEELAESDRLLTNLWGLCMAAREKPGNPAVRAELDMTLGRLERHGVSELARKRIDAIRQADAEQYHRLLTDRDAARKESAELQATVSRLREENAALRGEGRR
jgi:hypothetical protein